VGIAGAGGLGSNLAHLLVRSGFTRLRVVDFDRVEASNLSRQYYFPHQVGMLKVEALKRNLLAINPHLALDAVAIRIEAENALRLFAPCHIIAECLDEAKEKSMFIASVLPANRFLISVSGIGGIGDASTVGVHRIKDNLIIVGDLTSSVEKRPPFAPKVNAAAAFVADLILHHTVGSY